MSDRETKTGDGGQLGPFVRVDEDFTLTGSVDATSDSVESLIDQVREDHNVHVLVVSPSRDALGDFFQKEGTEDETAPGAFDE